ncbi:2-oxoglutarate-4-dioxygenase subunit alpha-1) [Durusdinium trenchii]|uniref:2-oxoglutarate-4-dioxygenase subunit alpha-1 n=1 Tax=Durusdinium trenchii TaxID=1381693 RepID=A0ABP0LR69_9DINO
MLPLLERSKMEGLARFLHNFVKLKSRKKLLPLHPMLGLALRSLLPNAPSETVAVTSLALCYAGVREGSAWQELAKTIASGPHSFSPRALAELAWSFSEVRYAHQGVFATLLRKMDGVKQMANDQERSVFCWASGNLGFNCSQIFGPPTANVDPQLAQSLFQRLSALGQQQLGRIRRIHSYASSSVQQALPPDVCAELIRKADQEGLWQNSTVVGGSRQVVMNNIRTSATATFNLPHHEEDELLYGIRSWAAQLLGLPTDFVEPLQIARYSCGQEYKRHFDWRSANFNGIWIFGQRVATILVYLKTLPAGAGGETEFNQLNLQVTPVEGTAAIWPNVDVAGCPNVATSHLAKPVLQDGVVKYALNIWITNKPYPNRTWIGWGR